MKTWSAQRICTELFRETQDLKPLYSRQTEVHFVLHLNNNGNLIVVIVAIIINNADVTIV